MKATSSFIVYDEFDLDNVIRLKYRTDKSFEVELITRDVDDEEIKHSHILEGDELKIIPEGLASLMKEVLDTKETRAVKGKNLG